MVGKCTKYFTRPVITENDRVLHTIKTIAFLYNGGSVSGFAGTR